MQGIGRERKKQKASRLSTLFLPLLYAPVAQLCQNISASQLYTQCPFYLLYFLTFTSKLLLILQPQPTYPFQVNHLWLLDYIRFPLHAPVGFCAFSFTSLIMYYYSYMFHFLASPMDHKFHEGRSHVRPVHNDASSSDTVQDASATH